jgi:stage V sporulation protein G
LAVEITEVRIKLTEDASERLKAFCSITLDDCFVIRDLKIIEGTNGPFVAMPSRKLTAHCPQCGCKNHLRAAYCNQCGLRLKDDRAIKDEDGRAKLYADIAHPINSGCREMIQQRVIAEFALEQDRAQQPGYKSRYDDVDMDMPEPHIRPAAQQPAAPPRSTPTTGAPAPAPEHSRIEPRSAEPPAPHHPPQAAPPRTVPQRREKGGFGEGIF